MSIEKGVLCFLIDECYIRLVKRYYFVRKYDAVPVQLEIVVLHYIGWCVLILHYIIIIIKVGSQHFRWKGPQFPPATEKLELHRSVLLLAFIVGLS